jgi:hypothetical protein
MAIGSYYQESIALRRVHEAKVVLCTVPGDPSLFKYSWFENHNYILDLETVLKGCVQLDYLLIHIPAIQVDRMVEWLASVSSTLLRNAREVHLNILLMHIGNIRGKNVAGLKRFGKLTCAAAHEAYTNSATREAMDAPLHRLSVCIGPECYSIAKYQEKEPLLIVSPDPHPLKEQVLRQIAQVHPDLMIKIIDNITYEEYKDLARRAKWSLTFGEGLDGYFIEPIFSGGVSFAVFNNQFFTPPFANLKNVYESWDALMEKLGADMKRIDEQAAYHECWRPAYDLLCNLYSSEQCRENLRRFYRGEYTFP